MDYLEDFNKGVVLYNRSCIDVMDDMIAHGVKVNCIVTDPPYRLASGGRKNSKLIINCSSEGELKSGEMFQIPEFKDWAKRCYEVLEDGSHAYFMTNTTNLNDMLNELLSVGFKLHEILVWDKGCHTPQQYYLRATEFVLFVRKGKAKYINNMGTKNILSVPAKKGDRAHPSEKPVELMRIFIENSTSEGDIVFEPFMGGGSTGVASIMSGRQFIGCEVDDKYFNVSVNRVKGCL